MKPYATEEDIEMCRLIHKQYGTTYYYSTLRLPAKYRRRVHSIYAFVRVPDEWVDNPGEMSVEEQLQKLDNWRDQLLRGLEGVRPEHAAMRAFCDTMVESRIPLEEAHYFLDAMRMDIDTARYATYEDLRGYMRGSASAIGVMMCHAMCARTDFDTLSRAKALGEAMQLTNFLRDVSEDIERGRIYLPLEDLARFGVTVEELKSRKLSPSFKALMKFEIERARQLYAYSDFGILKLPDRMRRAILLARLLYAAILDRIEQNGYDIYTSRARTNVLQKSACALRVAIAQDLILQRLVGLHGGR